MSKRNITRQGTVNPGSDSASVNALKCQFFTDMELGGPIILAAIMSGRPIPQKEKEDTPVTDSKLKCPHCGSDQLTLLEQLPRPRSRSPSSGIFTRT